MLRMIAAIVVASTMALSGCASIHVGESRVNETLFKSPDDLSNRAAGLKKDMSRAQVYSKLGINAKTPNTKQLGTAEIWAHLNGASSTKLNNDDIPMTSLNGQEVGYVDRLKSGHLAKPFDVEYVETGHDLVLVLVFVTSDSGDASEDQLYFARVIGTSSVDKKEKKLLVNPFEDLRGAIRLH